MGLNEKIGEDLRSAMTAKDEVKVSTLRLLKSALKYDAIQKKKDSLDDADVLRLIQKQIKQRRESIDQFKKGGRGELAQKEAAELKVLEAYLPKQVSDEELEKTVAEAVRKEGASSKKDFGRMMKLLNEQLAGRAESKKISDALGKHLK